MEIRIGMGGLKIGLSRQIPLYLLYCGTSRNLIQIGNYISNKRFLKEHHYNNKAATDYDLERSEVLIAIIMVVKIFNLQPPIESSCNVYSLLLSVLNTSGMLLQKKNK